MTAPRVIAYIASSVNGYIADEKGTEEWVHPASWKRFVKVAERFGNLIAGVETFKLLAPLPELKEVYKVCLSKTLYELNGELDFLPKQGFIWPTPETAIGDVQFHGYKDVLVAGGSQTLGSFIASDWLDELWVDVEPSLLGSGTLMLPPRLSITHSYDTGRFLKRLHLIDCTPEGDEVFLCYRIEKEQEQSGT